MRITFRALLSSLTLAGVVAIPAATGAQEGHEHHASTSGPVEAVEAFHEALATGDREGALALFADDVVVFESGHAEMSPAEYASHHLGADMEFAGATERVVVDRRVRETGHSAWVLTRSETRGSFRGRDIAARGTETMVLEHGESGWRITHIHWSSSTIEDE